MLTLMSGIVVGCSFNPGTSPGPSRTAQPTETAEPPTAAPSPTALPFFAGSIELRDSDCQFEAPLGSIEPGLIEMTFMNHSSDRSVFHLWRLDEGHTFAEFEAFIANHKERMEKGFDTGAPPFARQITGPSLQPGTTAAWRVNVIAATYAVACIVPNEIAGRLVATYSAGPIVIAGS